MVKVPAVPPCALMVEDGQLCEFQGSLWLVFCTIGAHALAWNELRHYGPVPNMRFDPQVPPPAIHPDSGVMYSATLPTTALAEVYQTTRVIDRSAGDVTLVSWVPSRPVTLLDLTTNWPVQNGAAAAMMDDKKTTQAWAAAIEAQLGGKVDGLYHVSSIKNQPLVTLLSRVERHPAFPARPSFYSLLRAASCDEIVMKATIALRYESV